MRLLGSLLASQQPLSGPCSPLMSVPAPAPPACVLDPPLQRTTPPTLSPQNSSAASTPPRQVPPLSLSLLAQAARAAPPPVFAPPPPPPAPNHPPVVVASVAVDVPGRSEAPPIAMPSLAVVRDALTRPFLRLAHEGKLEGIKTYNFMYVAGSRT